MQLARSINPAHTMFDGVTIQSCVTHARPFRGKDRVMIFEKINNFAPGTGKTGNAAFEAARQEASP